MKGALDLIGFAAAIADGRIAVVDLTHTLAPDFPTIVMPPELGQCAPFRMEEISHYDERGPAWYWNNISMGEHTGTHFDAPVHWVSGKDLPNNSVDAIPPAHFIAPACVVDVSREAAQDADFVLTVADVEAWEARHGRIPPRSWILLRTDWSKRHGRAYVNMGEDGQHSPGPGPEAVRWLLAERDVHGFGTETIGTDAGQAFHFTPPYPAHHFMHGRGRYGLQCLTNLDLLPPQGAVIIAAPLKIRRGSGSPLRVLGLVPREAMR
jgi:kynurenine formamidase